MADRAPYRVALVGIDGSGKTAVAQGLAARAAGSGHRGDLAVLHAVRPHENGEGPARQLSRHLHRVSLVADRLGSPELKIGTYYLQLRTYSSVERHVRDRRQPRVILAERHPLIDTMVYLPLYGRMAAARPSDAISPDEFARQAATVGPLAMRAVLDWAERVGAGRDLWLLGRRLLALHDLPPELLLKEFRKLMRTELPHKIILLDIGVEQALARIAGRRQGAEMHETGARLAAVRDRYDLVLGWLADARGVPVLRIGNNGTPVARTVDAIYSGLTEGR
ncbi:hypothetical protein [Micromonospora aurantiaca]|uniref:hypothetical protein n=1 Tax=Micromonospora aurantiaca (nom. illeg.) TaxID=47850 RepID=UPI0038191B38